MWVFTYSSRLYLFPQLLQEYGFSPVWIFTWRCNAEVSLNLFPQVLQRCGFSSVWIFTWVLKCDFWMNLFPQVLQECGLSPVWILRCLINLDFLWKSFPHMSHIRCLCLFWGLLWLSDTEVLFTLWLRLLFLPYLFFFSSAFLADPESTRWFSSWSRLSASGEMWEMNCSLFGSGSL